MKKPHADWWGDDEPYRMIGSGHSVSGDAPKESVVERLREVVAEVTRGRIPVPEKRGPRF